MKRKMTDFALGAKCGDRSLNGFNASMRGALGSERRPSSCARTLNASAPKPALVRARKSRLEYWADWMNTLKASTRFGEVRSRRFPESAGKPDFSGARPIDRRWRYLTLFGTKL